MGFLPRSRRSLALVAGAVVLSALAGWWSLRGPTLEDDPLFPPRLPPEFVSALTAPEDSVLGRWVREAGFERTRQLNWILNQRASELSLEEFTRRLPEIEGYQTRLTRLMAREFDGQYYVNKLAFLNRHSPAERQRLLRRQGRIPALYRDDGVSTDQKIEMLQTWRAEAEADGDSTALASCLYGLSHLSSYREDRIAQRKYLEAALEIQLAQQAHRMASQVLGVLGDLHEAARNYPEMIRCYEQARRLADRGRIPDQAGRINAFYAGHYVQTGRLALAHDLLYEAIRSCREYKGDAYELRYLCTAMGFYAELSAWEIVADLLDRAHRMKVLHPGDPYLVTFDKAVRQFDARLAMAQGRVEEANQLYRDLIPELGTGRSRVTPVKVYFLWAEGLLSHERFDRALEVSRQGRSRAEDALLPALAAQMALLASRAEMGRHNPDGAAVQLEDFDRLAGEDHSLPPENLVTRDELTARIALARGDTTEAVRLATLTMSRLVTTLAEMDPSTHSYLWLEGCDGVRLLWHELAEDDPWAGYGLELWWRDLPRTMGRGAGAPGAVEETRGTTPASREPFRPGADEISLARLAERGRIAAGLVRKTGGVHCLYATGKDEIRRWVADGSGLRRESLDLRETAARDRIARARELIQEMNGSDPSAAAEAELHGLLRELAGVLLPPEVLENRTPESVRTLLVTASGPLGALPFEALDLAHAGTYEPVLETWDVAYLRHAEDRRASSPELPGLVVANSEVSRGPGRGNPFTPRLEEVAAECRTVAGHDPGIRLLSEDRATKNEVRAAWERAGFVYFATHVTRDPRAPYLAAIPLSAPDSLAEVESLQLTLEDIRRARFDACRLVVLSGCSSGLPYVTRFTAGPSLADAFLDAGAGAVVRTFWDVPDRMARNQMESFTERWLGRGEPMVHALAEVKRAARRAQGDGNYGWATYAVGISTLSDLEP